MVRFSKTPYQNFEHNIRRARALARLDGYLDDIIHNEGRNTVAVFTSIPKDVMKWTGLDEVMDEVSKELEERLRRKWAKERSPLVLKEVGQKLVDRLKPRLKKIQGMFEDLGLLMDQTLREQALVSAVSAFEVYLHDAIVSVISLNPRIKMRFHDEINKSLSTEKLQEYSNDVGRTAGEIVAEGIKLDTASIKSLLQRLISLQNIFTDRETEEKIRRIFEHRHLIVHRAGTVDPKFKRFTRHKGAIGRPIMISRKYVLDSIELLVLLTSRIEEAIDSCVLENHS